MPKPSIFSKDYDEKMRKRKKLRTVVLSVVAVLAIVIFLFSGALGNILNKESNFGFNKLKMKLTTIFDSKTSEKKDALKVDENKKVPVKEDNKKGDLSNETKGSTNSGEVKEDINKAGEYAVKLSNGEDIKLQFTIVNNEKHYTGVLSKGISYDISPSKKNIVLVENSTQNMLVFDVNGNSKDVTKKQYVSSKGTVFNKDEVITANKSYVWCSIPKFLNEDTVLYTSQLPWFNKGTTKFLWKYTISSNKHYHNLSPQGGELYGNKIEYGSMTGEGLEVILDEKKTIIK